MELLKMTGKKISNLRFGLVPCIMFILMTLRTFISGNGVMISGLCVAFLPFFAQLRSTVCTEECGRKENELLSIFLMNLIFIAVGMLYLRGITWLGSIFYAGYTASPVLRELFLLTYLCDIAFISITVPLTFALQQSQRTVLAVSLANLEIAFMLFANKALLLLGNIFMLEQSWLLYGLTILLPVISLSSFLVKEKAAKNLRQEL